MQSILLTFLFAPVIEEVLKPSGVLHLLNKYPNLLTSRWQVAWLSMLGGATFATIENLLYVYVYHPHEPTSFVVYRFVVCTALHVICSGILGWGLGEQLPKLQKGEIFFDLENSTGALVTAIAIHAVFNTSVFALHVWGVKLY